jgi:RimJ/RimL family protein N-acetyltransferase
MTAVVEGELARGRLIVLRKKTIDDAKQDYEWRRDPELATFDAARPYAGAFNDYLQIADDELRYPSLYRQTLSVEDMEGRHIGNVMYYNADFNRKEAELGVTIGVRDYWSRGYGTDLIRTFVGYMFDTFKLDRIYLKTLDWNFRAQRCFEKAGFRRYDTSRRGEYNFVLMEIFRKDFVPDPEAGGTTSP